MSRPGDWCRWWKADGLAYVHNDRSMTEITLAIDLELGFDMYTKKGDLLPTILVLGLSCTNWRRRCVGRSDDQESRSSFSSASLLKDK